MRNVSARSHEDFDDYDNEDQAPKSRMRLLFGERPAKRIVVTIAVLLGSTIVFNALFLQDQRHAAPLFNFTRLEPEKPAVAVALTQPAIAPVTTFKSGDPTQSIKPAARQDLTAKGDASPLARAEAPMVDSIAREISKTETPPPNNAAKLTRPKVATAQPKAPSDMDAFIAEKTSNLAREHKSAALKTADAKLRPGKPVEKIKPVQESNPPIKAQDQIANLISHNSGASSPSATLSAQRALQKLGYVVRADGVNNEATRQAIQSFERDNALPVKGELSPKVMQTLAKMAAQ